MGGLAFGSGKKDWRVEEEEGGGGVGGAGGGVSFYPEASVGRGGDCDQSMDHELCQGDFLKNVAMDFDRWAASPSGAAKGTGG